MQKRNLSTTFETHPLVNIKGAPGTTFVGKLIGGPRVAKTSNGPRDFYTFEAKDGNADYVKKDAKTGEFVQVAVTEGDKVEMMVTDILSNALKKAQAGEIIEIVFNGKKKSATSGRTFNDFTVNVLEG